jgi:hypothetical protein
MDPDSNLRDQRAVRARLLAAFDAADPETGEWHPDLDDVYQLAELSEALDNWLSRDGAVPGAWQSDDPNGPHGWALSDPI